MVTGKQEALECFTSLSHRFLLPRTGLLGNSVTALQEGRGEDEGRGQVGSWLHLCAGMPSLAWVNISLKGHQASAPWALSPGCNMWIIYSEGSCQSLISDGFWLFEQMSLSCLFLRGPVVQRASRALSEAHLLLRIHPVLVLPLAASLLAGGRVPAARARLLSLTTHLPP